MIELWCAIVREGNLTNMLVYTTISLLSPDLRPRDTPQKRKAGKWRSLRIMMFQSEKEREESSEERKKGTQHRENKKSQVSRPFRFSFFPPAPRVVIKYSVYYID
jgi:hypothetical protein